MGISRKRALKSLPGMPTMPKGLTGTAAGCWRELMATVEIAGTLTRADFAALELLAGALAQHRKACEQIELAGEVVELPNGILAANPWVRIRKNSGDFLQRMLGEFAMTPTSRARAKLAAPTPDEDNALAEFLTSPGGGVGGGHRRDVLLDPIGNVR